MKIKLIHPLSDNPDQNLRVFSLEEDKYYLLANTQNGNQWPLVTKVYEGWKWINFMGKIKRNPRDILQCDCSEILFEVNKKVAHAFIWFFFREHARNEFNLNIKESVAITTYRHSVIELLSLEIKKLHENSPTHS